MLGGGVAKLGTPDRRWSTGRPGCAPPAGDHLLGACLRAGAGAGGRRSRSCWPSALWFGAPAIARLTAGRRRHVVAEHTAGLRVLALFLPLPALTDALLAATRGYRAMRPDRAARPDPARPLQLLLVGAVGSRHCG